MTPPSEHVGSVAQTGPFLYTFTFRLPYVLGIRSGFEVTMNTAPYASASDADTFARPPFVRIRFLNQSIADYKFLPANLSAALATFYGDDVNDLEAGKGMQLYEQWASMETPAVLLADEAPADGAYGFHRGPGIKSRMTVGVLSGTQQVPLSGGPTRARARSSCGTYLAERPRAWRQLSAFLSIQGHPWLLARAMELQGPANKTVKILSAATKISGQPCPCDPTRPATPLPLTLTYFELVE